MIMKSTVPAGTGDKVRCGARGARARPRRLRLQPGVPGRGPGRRGLRPSRPDRRSAPSSRRTASGSGRSTTGIDAPIVYCDVPSAEMIKLASNAFLATRISFINEIANVCELTGADVEQVAEGMGLDRRIGPHFLHAGIGYGGSCFPKDVTALKQLAGNSGYHFQLLSSVIEVNELQKRRVIGKLEKQLGSLAGKVDRDPRAHLQARHQRHARGRLDRARLAPAGRGRRGARLGPDGRRPTAICAAPASARASSRPSRAPTPP